MALGPKLAYTHWGREDLLIKKVNMCISYMVPLMFMDNGRFASAFTGDDKKLIE